MSRKYYYRSNQCSCVRTISSKTQGELDGLLEVKTKLQLPLIGHEHYFLLFGYQQEFLEVTGILLSSHLLEDITATLLEENEIF